MEFTAGQEPPAVECMFKANRFCTEKCTSATPKAVPRQEAAAGVSTQPTQAPKTQVSRSSHSRNLKNRQKHLYIEDAINALPSTAAPIRGIVIFSIICK